MTTTRLRRYRAPAILMLLLHLAGCKTMQPLEGPYTTTLPQHGAGKARVTTLAGDRVTMGFSHHYSQPITNNVYLEIRRLGRKVHPVTDSMGPALAADEIAGHET